MTDNIFSEEEIADIGEQILVISQMTREQVLEAISDVCRDPVIRSIEDLRQEKAELEGSIEFLKEQKQALKDQRDRLKREQGPQPPPEPPTKIMSRRRAAKLANMLINDGDLFPFASSMEKGNQWHFGRQELRYLFDAIYGGEPVDKDEMIHGDGA